MKKIKRYDEFLLEYDVYHDTRSKPIGLEKGQSVLEVIEKYAPWYLENIENITPVYRGVSGNRYKSTTKDNELLDEYYKAFLINPSEHKRYARNTENYYIDIIENSEDWSKYPKRSESIICSFFHGKADKYGKVYRVIPIKENSSLAICPRNDVFFSFPVLFKELGNLTEHNFNDIANFNRWLAYSFGIPEEGVDAEFIRNRMHSTIMELKETEPEDFYEGNYNHLFRSLARKIVNGEGNINYEDFYGQIEEWMDPEDNGFKLVKYNRNSTDIGERNEVYTDANCLLVLESELEKELKEHES